METQTVDPQTEPELNLLLEWPNERSGSRWTAILSGSVCLHLLFFFAAIQLPSFVRRTAPERTVVLKRTRLYLPPDVLTQKAPNRQKLSKQIGLADLLASRASEARRPAPSPSTKRFEVPKQIAPQPIAKSAPPQITAQPPNVALNEATAPALPVPSAPKNPFQNVGPEPPLQTQPKLAAPDSSVQAAIDGLARNANGRRQVVSDDNRSESMPGAPGSLVRAP